MSSLPFMAAPVRVRTPATSANLGPGFDSLGLALDLFDEVTAEVAGDTVRVTVAGEGAGALPGDERHLVAATALTTFDRLGGRPAGLALHCHNRIPHARGLGSSSAAIVSGILLARALVADGTRRLPDPQVLSLASELEGHPDNVAPCLLGGFTVAWSEPAGARASRLEPVPGVGAFVYVPAERGLTAHARAALPASVAHRDASFNVSRAALLVHALTRDPALLFAATEDRLHQQYRAAAMPETAALVRSLREVGLAAVVSGAGPSVLAFASNDKQYELAASQTPHGWCGRPLAISPDGGRILGIKHAEGDSVAAGLPR